MIKAVLFDYGGVITHGGKPGMLSNNLAVNLTIPEDHATALLGYGFGKIQRGLIDEEGFWHILERAYGSAISMTKRNIWMQWDNLIPIPKVMQLRTLLQACSIKTGILSNVEPMVARTLFDHEAYSDFNPRILSYEVGYVKPEIEIYRIAIHELGGMKPEEILFIDDQEKMLGPAKELGMQTLLARTTEQLIAEVKVLVGIEK